MYMYMYTCMYGHSVCLLYSITVIRVHVVHVLQAFCCLYICTCTHNIYHVCIVYIHCMLYTCTV